MGILSMIGQLFAKTYWREDPIVAHLLPYLPKAATVLDIGAGGCRMAKLVGMRTGVEVTAVDIVDHNVTDLPLIIYDGESLPFANKVFDISIIAFVLHHASAPTDLLIEAIRVTRSAILVIEDAPSNFFERGLWRAWDYVLNHGAHADIQVAHHARSRAEWIALLNSIRIEPKSFRTFRTTFPVLRTYPHVMLYIPLNARDLPGADSCPSSPCPRD
jgi:ubiquinone/menaquinone biosynthesis C-methylase UbiE